MANRRGNAYGLTALCPILPGNTPGDTDHHSRRSPATALRDHLEALELNTDSPFAAVPNTYLARLYVLNDVIYQGKPATYEHLKSKYLVFDSNFHGDLDVYLTGLWQHMSDALRTVWSHCIAFDAVSDAASFIRYIKSCQIDTTFFFVGSNDVPLAEQLKALYLKQEFSKFVYANQGVPATELQSAFQAFIERVQPDDLNLPTWRSGATDPATAVNSAKGAAQ